ncbi:MAG: asparagine synthase (glutamine-hydrolyzing) [Bryobacterales bacterium]|nr:asparagine synthase (glutamine-hydrolyzing) [Bryobacterales bacterium]
MCGIAGYVGRQDSFDPLPAVRRMLGAIAHRGPDGEGVETWNGVALGHRRLAILDLSDAGRQPMLSPGGEVGVVFNGCIYNFLELRAELEACGHRFRSNCDTEVLVNGYLEWGIHRLIPRLRGMFALGVWDNRTRELFLVRDRLGVKPLIYTESEGRIAFSSTVAALRDGGFGGDLDAGAVLEFLEFGFVTDASCIYDGILKLPPGHILEWREGRSSLAPYWELTEEREPAISFEDAVEETERLLLEAVRLRLIADVPIGVLLSGGVDSGLICWALTKLGAPICSFTVGTPGDPEDETAAARETARKLGIANQTVAIAELGDNPLDDLRNAYSEPFASSSALGVLRVSRAVKDRATVLLTGDGGDDVFLGYSFFLNAWRAQRLAGRVPAPTVPLWNALRPLLRVAPAGKRAHSFLSYAFGGVGAYARVRLGIPYFEERGLFGPRLRGGRLAHREVPGSLAAGRQLLDDVLRFHQRNHFLSEFMVKVDGATMWHALEARSPFLDHTIWDFAARLPYSVRFHDGQPKAVLREIARRRLGDSVARREKSGFSIPADRWLLDRWSEELRQLGHSSVAAGRGWFDQQALAKTVTLSLRQRQTSPQLWHAVVFENWLRGQP